MNESKRNKNKIVTISSLLSKDDIYAALKRTTDKATDLDSIIIITRKGYNIDYDLAGVSEFEAIGYLENIKFHILLDIDSTEDDIPE